MNKLLAVLTERIKLPFIQWQIVNSPAQKNICKELLLSRVWNGFCFGGFIFEEHVVSSSAACEVKTWSDPDPTSNAKYPNVVPGLVYFHILIELLFCGEERERETNRGLESSSRSPCSGLDIMKTVSVRGSRRNIEKGHMWTHRWPRSQCGLLRNFLTVLPHSGPHSVSVWLILIHFKILQPLSPVSVQFGADLVICILRSFSWVHFHSNSYVRIPKVFLKYKLWVFCSTNRVLNWVLFRHLSKLWVSLSKNCIFFLCLVDCQRFFLQARVIQFGLFKTECR